MARQEDERVSRNMKFVLTVIERIGTKVTRNISIDEDQSCLSHGLVKVITLMILSMQ